MARLKPLGTIIQLYLEIMEVPLRFANASTTSIVSVK